MTSRLFPLAAILAIATLAGCSKHRMDAAGSAADTPRKVFHYGNYAEPQDLDPQQIQGVPESNLSTALFEGLVSADPKDLHVIPGLASRWDISEDGTVYTFHLREGLRWSNGDPMTAEDFLLSYKRMISPRFASKYAYLIYNFVKNAKAYYDGKITDFGEVGFKAPDDRTLVVTLEAKTPFLLKIISTHYSWYAVPVRVLLKYGALDESGTAWTRAGNFVGSGAYMLKEWTPQKRIVVVRNPYYWDREHVLMDEIDYLPIDDIPGEERSFRAGQLDKTQEVPLTKLPVYRKEHPEELHIDPYAGIYFYRCNVSKPPLDDKRVRKALALAIDREELIRDVTRDGAMPAYAVSYPGTAGYYPKARLEGGLPEAKRLLAEAGYPDGKGMPPIELLYNTQDNHRLIAEAIQAMWRVKLGVNLTLRNEEWKVYMDSQHTRNYQLERAGWIADYEDPHVFLEIWETGNGNNDTNWGNPRYDALLHKALNARTEEERYSYYQQMDEILVDECPVIPIYYYTRPYLLNPKVRGLYPTLLDFHPPKYFQIEP